jgi:hypothetical protein
MGIQSNTVRGIDRGPLLHVVRVRPHHTWFGGLHNELLNGLVHHA